MNKYCFIFVFFAGVLFSLSFISSNFACGIVSDSEEFSSSWGNVLIYEDEKPLKIASCKINPENKFCCDIEELGNFTFGDEIYAEVFDEELGIISESVSLVITGEGYEIFPQLNPQKAIYIHSPSGRIFVNQSNIYLNLSLASNYNSLNYSLKSSNKQIYQHFCENCNEVLIPIELEKGENELTLISYGKREISEKLVFYNLDYFNIKNNVICDKCSFKGEFFYIPSNEEIIFTSAFSSSHPVSGDFLLYFSSEWDSLDNLFSGDFSETHNTLKESIDNQKEFSINYSFISPEVLLKTDYQFYQSMYNQNKSTKLRVFRTKLIPFHKAKDIKEGYFNKVVAQRASPDEPIVFNYSEGYLNLVAIFPNKNISKSHSNVKFEENTRGRNNKRSFTILSSIPQNEIEDIFLIFKVEKNKTLQLFYKNKPVFLDLYNQDNEYIYYSTYVSNKGKFAVEIY